MKKISLFILGALFLGFAFTSCEKDDENPALNSHMKYNEVKYPLNSALFQYFGETTNNNYIFDFYALSPEITIYESEEGEIDSARGVGEIVYFHLYSESSSSLKNGVYEYDSTNSGKAGTFGLGLFGIDYDIGLDNGVNRFVLKEGKVAVKKIGNIYKIGFKGKDLNDKKFTGYFIGPAKIYDYSNPTLTRKNKRLFFLNN